MFKTLASLFFLLTLFQLSAQQRVALNSIGGFVIAHRTVMQNLVTGHVRGGELTYETALIGSKSWHSLYRYPSVGVSLSALDLGNPVELGQAYGLTPYLRLPLIKKNDHLAFKFGLGLGVLTRHFNRLENHKNVAIGSACNASIVLGLWYKAPLGKLLALQTGIQLQHFSNGSFRSPNLGVNLPMLSVGLQFGKQQRNTFESGDIIVPMEKDSVGRIYISPRVGMKELLSTGGHKYLTYALHLSRLKAISSKYSYTLFMDVLYNSSLKEEMAENELVLDRTIDYAQLGAGAGMENHYGRFAIYLQMAAYLYSKQPGVGRIYHRLGIKHDLGKNGYISFGLKSHFAKADYIELGCGLRLR